MCLESHLLLGPRLSRFKGRVGVPSVTKKLDTVYHRRELFLTYLYIDPVKRLKCSCFSCRHASQVHKNGCRFCHLSHRLCLRFESNYYKHKQRDRLNERSLHMAGKFFPRTLLSKKSGKLVTALPMHRVKAGHQL